MLHDTPDKPAPNRRKSRAQERLELLELVYESFLQKFCSQGSQPADLEIPQEYNEVFGEQRRALDAEWRRYMRGLTTDLSQVLKS